MRANELDARDGLQLAGALVEHKLDMRQRPEPRPEARIRLADPLRDGHDAPAHERVHVQHAVRLPEPERAQDDRFGLVRAPGHGSASLVLGVQGTFRPRAPTEALRPDRALDRAADPDRRLADRRLHRALPARPRRPAGRPARRIAFEALTRRAVPRAAPTRANLVDWRPAALTRLALAPVHTEPV